MTTDPFCEKHFFLSEGIVKQTSREKELFKPYSFHYDKPDQKEKLHRKKNTEPEEVLKLNPILWSLQEKYDKNTLWKVLSLICKVLRKILKDPNPVTQTDRSCGNIRTIKRGIEKAEEILISAGFCIDTNKN